MENLNKANNNNMQNANITPTTETTVFFGFPWPNAEKHEVSRRQ